MDIDRALASRSGNKDGLPELPGRALTPLDSYPDGGADVLYVEDDDAWAALVDCWIGFMGLTVHRVRARSGFETYIDTCRKLPRCLLLDLRLGQESGLDLCDDAKRSPRLQAIPVILLTVAPIGSRESFKHGALHCIKKDDTAEPELRAALKAILDQHDHAQGVIDAGTLRLDGREGSVFDRGRLLATLDHGFFSAFKLLLQASPRPVPEQDLYQAFMSRPPYRKHDPELAVRNTLRNHVTNLRKILGDEIGGRIVRSGGGYALLADRSFSN